MHVVHGFKVVQVREDDSERAAIPGLPSMFAFQCVDDSRAITDAGQHVVAGAKAQFVRRCKQVLLQI